MYDLAEIRSALNVAPGLQFESAEKRASVALILRSVDDETQVFLIRRADKDGDPWSGHMAFPGGRVEATDRDLEHTARRETLEETELVITSEDCIGRIDDVQGRSRGRSIGLVISCFVFQIDADRGERPVGNYEVASTHWVPLSWFSDSTRFLHYYPPKPHGDVYPGMRIGDHEREILWGLTYRFMCDFFSRLGTSLPETTGEITPKSG